MRTPLDRLRHAILFEIIGLCLSVPLVAWGFKTEIVETGLLGIGMCLWAMIWNMIYNYFFDRVLVCFQYPLNQRSAAIRIIHAILFEAGLIIFSLPAVAWWLSISLWHAFCLDAILTLFFMGYALVYNWAYDKIFPYPELKAA